MRDLNHMKCQSNCLRTEHLFAPSRGAPKAANASSECGAVMLFLKSNEVFLEYFDLEKLVYIVE